MDELQNNLNINSNVHFDDEFQDANKEGFLLSIDGYDGPIDLLLDLAKSQKVDLLNISILELAEQYISYIKNAQKLNIEIASEYLVMAAWIAFLKSRILLPEDEEEEFSSEEISDALVFQLKRLEAIRRSGNKLFELNLLNESRFPRGCEVEEKEIINFEDSTLLKDLIISYSGVIRSKDLKYYVPKMQKLENIEDALSRLNRMLGQNNDWRQLSLFLPDGLDICKSVFDSSVLAVTFSASLELAKKGEIEIKQSKPFGDIFIRSRNKGGE